MSTPPNLRGLASPQGAASHVQKTPQQTIAKTRPNGPKRFWYDHSGHHLNFSEISMILLLSKNRMNHQLAATIAALKERANASFA